MPSNPIPILLLMLLFTVSAIAGSNGDSLARQAISPNRNESTVAIKSLRRMKQHGLNTILNEYSGDIREYKETGRKTELWKRISHAIDEVAMQKDAYASNLFWHVDLESARADAKDQNKPILTLRLLGNLNEEYSCANSRFFRSVLYSNTKIAKHLRENYILHWESVRPAPVVTIDFGDGRKIVRTITGNSIHYVLDQNGKIIDALPGLYSPKVFYDYLVKIHGINLLKPQTRQLYWKSQRDLLIAKWDRDLSRSGVDTRAAGKTVNPAADTRRTSDVIPVRAGESNEKRPTALDAATRAVTKSAVELLTVKSISYDVESLRETTNFENWKKLAGLLDPAKIDTAGRDFIRLKSNHSTVPSDPGFLKMISNLEEYISIDTVQNEYLFHTKIYEWLQSDSNVDLTRFNEKVYAQLFLSPRSDKWLGLYSSDIYSAIDGNGLVN